MSFLDPYPLLEFGTNHQKHLYFIPKSNYKVELFPNFTLPPLKCAQANLYTFINSHCSLNVCIFACIHFISRKSQISPISLIEVAHKKHLFTPLQKISRNNSTIKIATSNSQKLKLFLIWYFLTEFWSPGPNLSHTCKCPNLVGWTLHFWWDIDKEYPIFHLNCLTLNSHGQGIWMDHNLMKIFLWALRLIFISLN